MAHLITGLPTTLTVWEMRLCADKLMLEGRREEAQLLHALLDGYTSPGATAPRPATGEAEEMQEMRDEMREERVRAENAEAALSQLQEQAEFAADEITRALGLLAQGQTRAAKGVLAEALGALVSATGSKD